MATDAVKMSRAAGTCQTRNVGQMEQLASIGGGVALVAYGLASRGSRSWLGLIAGVGLIHRGWTGHCVVYEKLGICQPERHSTHGVEAKHGVKVETSILVNRPAEELYKQWSQLDQLPNFMTHLLSVTPVKDKLSHWVARTPGGWQLEWDAETIQQRPNELIAWQSVAGSQVDTAGSVHFRPVAGRGTEVQVSLKYDPPGGKMVANLAEFFGVGVEHSVKADLRRFKQWCETGETATTPGQPAGGGRPDGKPLSGPSSEKVEA